MMKTKIFFTTLLLFAIGGSYAQNKSNWYNLDLKTDGVFGISIDKSYNELLIGKKPVPVVVAVIDGGLDVNHEDLKKVVWTNLKEIPGNGLDDDKNGYIDDVNGWNFLGSSKESFEYDNYMIVMEIRKYQAKFGDKDSTAIKKKDLSEYRKYIAKRKELNQKIEKLNQDIFSTTQLLTDVEAVQKKLGKTNPTREDFVNFVPATAAEAQAKNFMTAVLQNNPDFNGYIAQTKAQLEELQHDLQYHFNIDYNPRSKYPDEFSAARGRFYGNGNLYGNVPPAHGTHVGGIVAAERSNNIGIDGVADAVKIMAIRAIPDGESLTDDQANAIRYAAENGAKVINMSFGLNPSTNRKALEDAVNYALSKDILFIQAAGNGHDNLDSSNGYPSRQNTADKKFLDAFIKVGASGYADSEQLPVPFSNYGKLSVDVFAPGGEIKSTIPDNLYLIRGGTSMASPVVAGLAAVIREYYPKLTAKQVKEIIVKSVVKRDALKNLCISGGVVNAFNALTLASTY